MKAIYTEAEFVKRAKIVLEPMVNASKAALSKAKEQAAALADYCTVRGHTEGAYPETKLTTEEQAEFIKLHGGKFLSDSPSMNRARATERQPKYYYHDSFQSFKYLEYIKKLGTAIGVATFAETVELEPEDMWMVRGIRGSGFELPDE